MIATEDVQRQIAIGVIVAVEEAAQLMAVQDEVRRVQVEDEALGRDHVLLDEGFHEEALHGIEVGDDLFVATVGVGPDGREFEAVERALAGQGFALVAGTSALGAGGVGLIDEDSKQGIVTEAVVVVEVAVAEAQGEDALLEEVGEGVLDAIRVAVIGEAAGELIDKVELGFDLAEKESAGVGGDRSAVEVGDDGPGAEVLEDECGCVTVCHGAVISRVGSKGLSLFPLCQLRDHRASLLVRNMG